MTATPNAQIVRQVRNEMLKENDLGVSETVDLMKRLGRDPSLSVYVRLYSLILLSFVMFTDDIMRVLKALYDTKHPIVLDKDARGEFLCNLAEHTGDASAWLNAVVVDNPKSSACPLAVLFWYC
ncbi:unnamed protein product [Allacma fusca]|uniref:Uncharacterized protein n=1 Tax=Allacma fusca TaxID=39272 RepID=A0A8J2K7U8_9HEXA|nr:unnamed protein product [Allacma fusca]